ncbi:MAG TPA: ATP-dependent endonuclease [Bacilli bacterium]|nr:ATP-dependent endonuclease [Bacilli bacterium]
MKLKKIKINNFRLLKEFNIDLEDNLSLVIGKNNCGKTSLITCIQKFISNKNEFVYDDFNLEFKNELYSINTNFKQEEKYENVGIKMKLFIEYSRDDNLSNISSLIMDLNPDNNKIILNFEYSTSFESIKKMHNQYNDYLKLNELQNSNEIFNKYMNDNYRKYFVISKKSIAYDYDKNLINEEEYIDIVNRKINIEKIINFQFISARRDITNEASDSTLSILASKYYNKIKDNEESEEFLEPFKNVLTETDQSLTKIYENIFKEVTDNIKIFGGVKEGETVLNVLSKLDEKEILKGNTIVKYSYNGEYSLPENFNGLGYLNLISILFEIEIKLKEFNKANKKEEKPSDINILFIEEPEAHTHPQMQYIFIKNIKNILNKSSNAKTNGFNLQTIITTHSSHIVSESEFNDIKYLMKKSKCEVISKNLKDLEKEYLKEEETPQRGKNEITNNQSYNFLKQYLTLNRAELFFADKAIFIEGDTERILMPAMMKKIDLEYKNSENETALCSQNISLIEVGNYSKVFEKFLNFIGIKSLIITDLDSAHRIPDTDENGIQKKNKDGTLKEKTKKCKVSDGTFSSNASLNYFFNDIKSIDDLINLDLNRKTFHNENNKWEADEKGNLLIVFQTKEINDLNKEYNASSFEDSFFHINSKFIIENVDKFNSLKNKNKLASLIETPYDFGKECIDKKTSFAIEILLNSDERYSNWKIPSYIEEGLKWLKN